MKISNDICYLIAKQITDLKTWHSFSLVCKNGYRATNKLFKDKRFEFANSYTSDWPKSEVRPWTLPDELTCCPGSDPNSESEPTQYIYYMLPINGVQDKWCFQIVRTHKGDTVEKTEYFRDDTVNYRTLYRHNGTIIRHTEFIRQKIVLNSVHHNIYNSTYYYPDGKTVKYTGRHNSVNPDDKFGYWSKYLEKGQLVCTEYWTAEHTLGHVTFHENINKLNENCEDLLNTSSESLEIIDIPFNEILPDTDSDNSNGNKYDLISNDSDNDSYQFNPNELLNGSDDSEIDSTADSLSFDSES